MIFTPRVQRPILASSSISTSRKNEASIMDEVAIQIRILYPLYILTGPAMCAELHRRLKEKSSTTMEGLLWVAAVVCCDFWLCRVSICPTNTCT